MASGLMGLFSGQPASPGVNAAPMGLLDLILGQGNPISQFADSRQNTLGAIGAGLASGPTFSQGMANAAQNIPQAKSADYQMNLYRGQVSQTVKYLQDKHPDLAQAVAGGTLSPSQAFQQAYQLDNAPPVPVAPGSVPTYLQGPKAGQTLGARPDGFTSQDMKSQAWNMVIKANSPGADPSLKNSPDFQAAYAIVSQPIMTPQGMMQPNLPPGWGPGAAPAGAGAPPPSAAGPSGMAAPPAMSGAPQQAPTPTSASVGDMSMVAPPMPPTQGPGIIPGTKPYNETQARLTYLTQSATPDLKRVVDGFPALMNVKDQLLSKDSTGLTRGLQDPAYQRASNAVRAAMGNIMYFVSGAAQGNVEVERKLDSYIPKFGEGPEVAADKLDRFANDIVSMANASNDAATVAWATQAVAGIKNTESQILGTSAAAGGAPDIQTLLDKYK